MRNLLVMIVIVVLAALFDTLIFAAWNHFLGYPEVFMFLFCCLIGVKNLLGKKKKKV